jgi:AraC-like DNA-binding protein
MSTETREGASISGVPSHERHFYAMTRAFGRFGMRIFVPEAMDAPHWHGHVEANFLTGARMYYLMDDREICIEPDQLVLFWAGIPHQLLRIEPTGIEPPRLANLYLPLDAFLFLPHIASLQVALLGGAMVAVSRDICDIGQIERWYADYRSNDFERVEIMKMELNALLRRSRLGTPSYLREPLAQSTTERALSSVHIRHVIAMVRYILENLSSPMTNADVAAVTGLHQNYALSLFSSTMRLPLKRFIIRMRLIRARALLIESSVAIATAAEMSGFTSTSQFYEHFRQAYGLSPHALRSKYTQFALR